MGEKIWKNIWGKKIWGKKNLGKKNLEKSEFFPPSIGAAPSTSNEDKKRATTTTTAKKSCKPTNLRAMKIHGFFPGQKALLSFGWHKNILNFGAKHEEGPGAQLCLKNQISGRRFIPREGGEAPELTAWFSITSKRSPLPGGSADG